MSTCGFFSRIIISIFWQTFFYDRFYITGPTGKQLTCNMSGVANTTRQLIEFTPLEVGSHTLSINYGGQPIRGSPFTWYSYDASRVRIVDITDPALPNEPLSFTSE